MNKPKKEIVRHLNSAKIAHAIGLKEEASEAFSRACEIKLAISNKNIKQ